MVAPSSHDEIRAVNERYHDLAAGSYDRKWGIDFGWKGRRQVLGKVAKGLRGIPERPFARSLEIGAGTGYFSLNLLRAGVVRQATCTDLAPGMLSALEANASELDLDVQTVRADAEDLPFADGAFDLVLGHAVLHHIPDLPKAMAEFARVLRPSGTVLFAGEPSRYGDRIAAVPKRGAHAVAPAWRALMGARAAPWVNGHGPDEEGHALERLVDVHAFSPTELASLAREAGFANVRVGGEELVANWFGWSNRALESTAVAEEVPWLWRQYAYRGYLALQEVDRRLLEGRLPAALFYNLLLSGRRPLV
ncbi:MAG: class I SAM-dependent methyltransferase [Solirubrobacteraceae bacterium]